MEFLQRLVNVIVTGSLALGAVVLAAAALGFIVYWMKLKEEPPYSLWFVIGLGIELVVFGPIGEVFEKGTVVQSHAFLTTYVTLCLVLFSVSCVRVCLGKPSAMTWVRVFLVLIATLVLSVYCVSLAQLTLAYVETKREHLLGPLLPLVNAVYCLACPLLVYTFAGFLRANLRLASEPQGLDFVDLFRPRWRCSVEAIRMAAVERISAPATLAKVATRAGHWQVRRAAVSKLTDQVVLARVAKSDKDCDVRVAAVRRLGDEALCARTAQTDVDARVRTAAVERLADQGSLGQIATTDKDAGVRAAAVEKLDGGQWLSDVVRKDSDQEVRRVAVKRLSDQSLLGEVARKDASSDVRQAAVKKLVDTSALLEICKTDADWHVRRGAVEALADQRVLAEIAQKDGNWHVREAAAMKLTAEDVRAEVARVQASLALPPFDGFVESLRFFGWEGSRPAQSDRVFQSEFPKSERGRVEWELTLKHPSPGHRLDFDIDAVWRRGDGSELVRTDQPSWVEANWSTAVYVGPSGLAPLPQGVYAVEIYVEGKRIATGEFRVLDKTVGATN